MPWHDFQEGMEYALDRVIAACERRIREGGVAAPEQKRHMLKLMQDEAPHTVVWRPHGSGWGASPFNPKCWQTTDKTPILSEDAPVYELPTDEDN